MALFRKTKTTDKTKKQATKSDTVKSAVKSKAKKKEDKTSVRQVKVAYKVLVHPLITEKSTIQNSLNQYAFVVSNDANKVEIKKAILEIYHVAPLKVRIINVMGKSVRSGRGKFSKRKNWKKAIISLPEGKKIDVYEGV